MDVKYVVVPARGEEDPLWFHEVKPPILCESKGRAEDAIEDITGKDDGSVWDWSVFEVVDGRCERRAVVFSSGRPEIQP